MEGFITKYQAELAEFSFKASITTSKGYFTYWINRYNQIVRELRLELPLKKIKYDPASWDQNLLELKQLRESSQTFRIHALRTLRHAAETAAERLRDTSGAWSTVNDEDEQEVDDDDAMVYADLDDVQKLIKFYIRHVDGEHIDDAQETFVKTMIEQQATIQDRLLASAAKSLLNKEGWSNQEEINTKLCLSSIVNLISSESVPFFNTILTSSQMTALAEFSVPKTSGLSDECIALFDELINESTIMEPESILENIYRSQAKYCSKRNSDIFKMLCILQQVISQFDDWSEQADEESKTTVFRRFAILIDILCRHTLTKMKDGECVAQTTQDECIALQAIAGFISTSNEKPYGSKIDLIATTRLDGRSYDLSSNEWKKQNACSSIVLKQQAKNIRTNASILSRLLRMGCTNSILAMDWKGVNGYAYTLSFTNGVFLAKQHTELMIPKRSTQLLSFKDTLKFLFVWKNQLLSMVASIDRNTNKDALRGIVKVTDNGNNSLKIPPVLITIPKSRKRAYHQANHFMSLLPVHINHQTVVQQAFTNIITSFFPQI